MSERLKYEGRLVERQREAKRLELKLSGLRSSMRDLLDPFEDIDELNLDIVAEQAIEARAAQIDYLAAREEIKAISKALGL